MVRPARHLPAALLLALTVLGAGACGSGGDQPATTTATTTAAAAPATGRYTAKQVAKIAGFTQNPDGTWTNPTGCRVTMILLTHEARGAAREPLAGEVGATSSAPRRRRGR